MYSKEAFEAMTVIDLRKIARENGISLSAGISKQGIVERLCNALVQETPAPQPAPAPAPVRRAAIVTDDEDTPVLTPNVPFSRSPAPAAAATPARSSAPVRPAAATAPAPGQPTINRGNIPGTNKPVFSLEGVRAWHNPRSYQQPAASNYTQPRAAQNAYGQPRAPQRMPSTVSRFGPDAVSNDSEAHEPAVQEQPYHAAPHSAPYSAESRPAYGNYAADYRTHRDTSALPELLAAGDVTDGTGVLELQSDGFGYLRTGNYLPGQNDIYISPAQVRRFHLQTGDLVSGKVRPKRENETHSMMLYITEVNDIDAQDVKPLPAFDTLTAIYPSKQILLSKKATHNQTLRAIDLMCPIGFGQRALIIAPSRCGKTALLTAMAASIHAQYPDAQLLSLMLGERPEDITIARDTLPGNVIYAGFDEPMENHTRIAELTLARAMRLAEQKKDVVLLVDSLTALCRAYSECAPQNVRILSGGLAAGSLAKPKRLFGSARALREGGSLTIIAIMLSDTGIPLDHAIAEEFRGTANMELYLNGSGQVDYARSLTRNAAAMLSSDARSAMDTLHQLVLKDGPESATVRINSMLQNTDNNSELIKTLPQLLA